MGSRNQCYWNLRIPSDVISSCTDVELLDVEFVANFSQGRQSSNLNQIRAGATNVSRRLPVQSRANAGLLDFENMKMF